MSSFKLPENNPVSETIELDTHPVPSTIFSGKVTSVEVVFPSTSSIPAIDIKPVSITLGGENIDISQATRTTNGIVINIDLINQTSITVGMDKRLKISMPISQNITRTYIYNYFEVAFVSSFDNPINMGKLTGNNNNIAFGGDDNFYQINPSGDYDIFKLETLYQDIREGEGVLPFNINVVDEIIGGNDASKLDLKLELYNSSRVKIQEVDNYYDKEILDLNNLPPAVYFLKVYHVNNSQTGKYRIYYDLPTKNIK